MIYAGPFAGLNLSDLGADVIKVESMAGEPFRHFGAIIPGHSKTFQWLNRGKRGLALDLQDERGQRVIHKMMPDIDVVVINYRPGVAKRLGIDYETLSAIRPDLIYADISGFGDAGPRAGFAASDIVAQAYGGAIALDAKLDDDGAPESIAVAIGDLATGMATAMGVAAALYHRATTGEGQRIGLSLVRTIMALTSPANMREPVHDSVTQKPLMEAMAAVREAGGSYDALIGVRGKRAALAVAFTNYYGGYRAKDGGIILGALTPLNREGFRRIFGTEDDYSDTPEFNALDPVCQEHALEIRRRIRELMLTRTVDEWVRIFDEAGVPASRVNFPEELPDDAHAKFFYTDLVHPVAGPQRQVNPIVEMDRTPTSIAGPAPTLGGDNDALLESLGYTAAEIEGLRTASVIV